jgi:SAM-dependent methyltransferase
MIGDPFDEREHVLSLQGVFADHAQLEHYVSDGWERIQVVLSLLTHLERKGIRRILELGSNPYIMTVLMRRRFHVELELANYFDEGLRATESMHLAELEGQRIEFPFRHFNIERDTFPYADHSFDCVLFCEILEHLLVNPDRAVAEMARILRPGGHLIVSTPNATRLSNLYLLALGESIWEGYSDHGAYGRHNREFTLVEVCDLLGRHGFDVAHAEARNIEHLARRFRYVQWLRPMIWNAHLFVVGRLPSPDLPKTGADMT